MANEITPGAVVQLKSGGPRMTTAKWDDFRSACWWFDADGDLQEVLLPHETLRVIRPAPKRARHAR